MRKILLIDGNSLLFRAYFASSKNTYLMKTSTGVSTNAIYNFAMMLTNLLDQTPYFDVKVAFDKGKKTFRHDKLEDYKAGRSATPVELIEQFPIAREFLDAAHITWYELDNYEADDLIGALAKHAEQLEDVEIEILSNDKDMYQLISDKIKILVPDKGVSVKNLFGLQELYAKWQITPAQVPDFKGLMGDSSDNLKGVKGIGEKTAIKLLQDYHTLENLYAHVADIKGANQTKLMADKASAFLCKELATIFVDIPFVDLKFTQFKLNIASLIQFFAKYEMHSLVKRFNLKTLDHPQAVRTNVAYHVAETWAPQYWAAHNYVYVESFEDNYHKGTILAIAIANQHGLFILPNWATDHGFAQFMQNPQASKITFNIKRVWTLLDRHNIKYTKTSFVFDHMVAMYVLDPNLSSQIQNLHRVVKLDNHLSSDDEIYNKGAKKSFAIDVELRNQFIISKAHCLQTTHALLLESLHANNQFALYEKIEFPLIEVLYTIEKNGILIDRQALEQQTIKTLNSIDALEAKMFETLKGKVDAHFNFASPKQIKELLVDVLEIKLNKKQSTDRESLEKLLAAHPVIPMLIEHRKLTKLYSTYLRGFEKFIFPDHKIHTILHQTLTNTGRLSSSDPNIQNISIKDETQKEVRKIFIAPSGSQFLSFDYSQIELRVLAQLGHETNLLNIFAKDGDIHDEAARLIFHLSPDQIVSSEQRRAAKVFNFGIIYGLSGFGLSQDLNVSLAVAKTYINNYYTAFPHFKTYKDALIDFAVKHGYALTFANRQRVIHELKSPMYQIVQAGKRIAVNTPIQGTAADILKVAMIQIHALIQHHQYPIKMVAQIHDEIIFEIPNDCDAKIIEALKQEMRQAFHQLDRWVHQQDTIQVNLEVNASIGDNWYELK